MSPAYPSSSLVCKLGIDDTLVSGQIGKLFYSALPLACILLMLSTSANLGEVTA